MLPSLQSTYDVRCMLQSRDRKRGQASGQVPKWAPLPARYWFPHPHSHQSKCCGGIEGGSCDSAQSTDHLSPLPVPFPFLVQASAKQGRVGVTVKGMGVPPPLQDNPALPTLASSVTKAVLDSVL